MMGDPLDVGRVAFSRGIVVETGGVITPAGNGRGRSEMFPPTHWSVVIAAAETEVGPEIAEAALAELCQTYWAPLYNFVRRRGYSVHDAQDLTQSFFAYLIEQKIYAQVDRQKGKFRSFLVACLKHFLSNASDRERALKRGAGQIFLALDEERAKEAESLFQTRGLASSEDQLFDRSWAESVIAAGLKRVETDYAHEAKTELFDALRVFLAGGAEPMPTYAELAARLGMNESTLRSHVRRLRTRYREALREEVRQTVATEAQVDDELHELFLVLSSS